MSCPWMKLNLQWLPQRTVRHCDEYIGSVNLREKLLPEQIQERRHCLNKGKCQPLCLRAALMMLGPYENVVGVPPTTIAGKFSLLFRDTTCICRVPDFLFVVTTGCLKANVKPCSFYCPAKKFKCMKLKSCPIRKGWSVVICASFAQNRVAKQ